MKTKENRLSHRSISRNGGLSKSSTTVLRLSTTTPFKVVRQDLNASKSKLGLTDCENSKQMKALRRENVELIQMLKKSKRVFESEMESRKKVIQKMNSILNMAHYLWRQHQLAHSLPLG